MAVIKCSNCENEILDTEIVCPYCDCPISETIKKMKAGDLQSYSDKLIDNLTGKIPPVRKEDEPEIATSSDFEKEKAAILKDLDTDVTGDEPQKDTKAEKEDTAQIPAADVNMGKTVKISREDVAKKADEAKKDAEKQKKAPGKPPKGNGAKKDSKKIILGIIIAGILIIAVLIWALASHIMGGYSEKEELNKPVVSEIEKESDAKPGFVLKSSTLTISDDSVMIDYDSPNETPWYENRNKIKHVVFDENVTKIGAHSFEGFEKIMDISLSDSVTKIGESAFCNCTSLEEISTMSKNIEEIDDYAFTGCKMLGKIPGYTREADFEPTINRIGVEAFKSCKALEEFKVPMYTEIGTDAFYGHGDEFVLVCETTSEAYDYAIEKGIPTKLSFDSEVANNETEENNNEEEGNDNKENNPPAQTTKENEKSETEKSPADNEPSAGNTTGTDTPAPSEPQGGGASLSELMKQLESATTQEEKDRILGEIDKITN